MAIDDRTFFSVNLPAALGWSVEQAARKENITPEQFVETAVKLQLLLRRHEDLKEFGKSNAEANGYTEADLPGKIAQSREEANKRSR